MKAKRSILGKFEAKIKKSKVIVEFYSHLDDFYVTQTEIDKGDVQSYVMHVGVSYLIAKAAFHKTVKQFIYLA